MTKQPINSTDKCECYKNGFADICDKCRPIEQSNTVAELSIKAVTNEFDAGFQALNKKCDELQQQNAELKSRLSDSEIVGERWLAWHDADVIEKAAEHIADDLQKEQLPIQAALGGGRFYSELIDYATQLRNQSKD